MAARPSGTVTFLFTDVEGSTAHWEARPGAMRDALALHDETLRSVIEAGGGTVFATAGDGFAAAFGRASSAVGSAIGAQRALACADWPHGLRLNVRMGLHTGESYERGGDYFGPAVNLAARVMDAANGSQVLLSSAVREIVCHDVDPPTVLIDLGEHDLRDVVDPVYLYRLADPRFPSDGRPPRTGSTRAGNLPPASGLLLGRHDEVESLIDDLAISRLVTVTGVGGIGKTRLALEVGRRSQTCWRDGVHVIGLDTIERPEAVVPALLGTLGIEPRAGSALDSLVEGLRFRHALLILDNCEHLLDAVAGTVAAIISSCPHAVVLATSREPLDVSGERVRRLSPLDVSDDGAAAALFALRAAEAAATVDPARDAAAIARVCRRLDGIPLAIELAAARARSLRPSEIADRLENMLELLGAGRRAGVERHRTLRAALEWSHNLLANDEKAALARLSVFAGTFALDAAEFVAAGSGDVVDVLDRLVARSLVVSVDEGDETRFRLLEPVRQLAAEKLADAGEAREAHTQWYLDLLLRLDQRWRAGDDQGAWPIAARELPNLKAAFDALVDAERIDDAQRFAVAGFGPIGLHFDSVPMYDWAPRAASLDLGHVGPATASVCALAAWGAIPRDHLEGAAEWLRRGETALEGGSEDDGFVAAAAIHHTLFGADLAVSSAYLKRSVDSARDSGDLHRQVWVFTYTRRLDEALAAALQLGNAMLIALARSWIAWIDDEDEEERWEALESFWEAAQRCHSFLMLNHAAHALGSARIQTGAPVEGLLQLRAPARDWLLRGDVRIWEVLHSMAAGLAATGDLVTAARLLGAIGDRRLVIVPRRERRQMRSLLEAGLGESDRERHARAGRELDAGMAVVEALERIVALARPEPTDEADAVVLTPRQHEVALLVARGMSNKQIALELGISRFTAETHVRNILERLGAASRSQIAAWAAVVDASGT